MTCLLFYCLGTHKNLALMSSSIPKGIQVASKVETRTFGVLITRLFLGEPMWVMNSSTLVRDVTEMARISEDCFVTSNGLKTLTIWI